MTLQPNANWTTENNATPKRPIYAVSLDGGTTWYHDYEITGATASHYKYLVSITGVPAEYNPVRLEASIGGVTFEVLTSTSIWNFDELYLTRIVIKAGYNDLDWSDYIELNSNMYIYNVKANSSHTGWVFTCQDIQKKTDKDIFTAATTGSPDAISARNPITFWLQIMTTITGDTSNGAYDVLESTQGLGIDQSYIDVTECELLRDDFIRTWQGAWTFSEPFNAKTFFQEDIYRAYSITPVLKANGKISLRLILPSLYPYMAANNMGSALTGADILPLCDWSSNYRDIINRIIFNYDYDYVDSEYDTQVTYNDTASQTKYGIQAVTINSKGITTALDGANLTQKIALRYFRRYGELPIKIKIETKFSARIIEPADQLSITSSHIPNLDTSTFVWSAKTAEVMKVTPDYKGGKMTFELADISFGGKRYGLIAPSGTADYGAASAAVKAKYCFISPSTGGNYLII